MHISIKTIIDSINRYEHESTEVQTLGAICIHYTINVFSKYGNIISHQSSVFEGRHNDHRCSKVSISIIHLRRSTHRSSIFESRHIDLRRSKAETSHRQFITEYCPQRHSIVIPKIPRGTYDIRRWYTCPYTYIWQQPHTCTSYICLFISRIRVSRRGN